MKKNSRKSKILNPVPSKSGEVQYHYEEESETSGWPIYGANIYTQVQDLEEVRLHGLSTNDPKHKLELITEEIQGRIKITQHEMFKIGQLLIESKKYLQQTGQKFEPYIKENFDFSLKTANNFMNVYKNCLGIRKVAMDIPASILYKVAAPSFPEELREYLFHDQKSLLMNTSNKQIVELVKVYKENPRTDYC